ncbi:hypothetical protein HMPREF0973_00160 [Prevotella veroralis F0319]|uniref:Uncharacterized protein n=1 Tax=Prevotella veroralis F0319 TaxID=649761 RepID=C9MKN6_9BACT|nr:hypothetical protein HMPREF0973_00160 [Prevotella veroralis F0319]
MGYCLVVISVRKVLSQNTETTHNPPSISIKTCGSIYYNGC